jgi:hypothetical protein
VDKYKKNLKNLSSIYGIENNYPQQNVDFVDNLLLSVNSFFLSTKCGLNVEKLFYNLIIVFKKVSIYAVYTR